MNIENLNRVIEAIRSEPNHFVMRSWNTAGGIDASDEARSTLARNNPCNTAGCIGGWMDSLALADIADGKMEAGASIGSDQPLTLVAAFAGVERGDLDDLFHMDHYWSMFRFDRLPDAQRAEAGARAVEIFRNTGESDWKRALEETGLLDYMRGDSITIDGNTYR
jgi:hypothetical protein